MANATAMLCNDQMRLDRIQIPQNNGTMFSSIEIISGSANNKFATKCYETTSELIASNLEDLINVISFELWWYLKKGELFNSKILKAAMDDGLLGALLDAMDAGKYSLGCLWTLAKIVLVLKLTIGISVI